MFGARIWQTKSIQGAQLQEGKNETPSINIDLIHNKNAVILIQAYLPQEKLKDRMSFKHVMHIFI